MKYVLLGGLYPKNMEAKLLAASRGNFQVAANTLQWKIVDGVESVIGDNVSIVTAPFVGNYPRHYSEPYLNGFDFSHRPGARDVCVGFLNLRVISIFSRFVKSLDGLRRLFSMQNYNDEVCILVYGMFADQLAAAAKIRREFPGVRVCLVVPDLAGMMGGDESRFVVRMFHYGNEHVLKRFLKEVDCFVFLSEFMVEKVPVGDRPWCVVEGIATESEGLIKPSEGDVVSILYSGTLARRYGIEDLVRGFEMLAAPHYRLWVCGAGDWESQVRCAALNDKRISFFGQLSNSDVLSLQAKATLLANPRTSAGEFTRYSFPSKIMEYFASGTPCIMHRLPGVPAEYFEHCIVPFSEDAEGIRDAILSAEHMGKDRLRNIGLGAREFILREKTGRRQCEKIVGMVEGLLRR